MAIVKCIECGKDFEAKRITAKFCSPNCRVKWNNKLGNLAEKVTTADKIPPKNFHIKDNLAIINESWMKEIEDYCQNEDIEPQELIKSHKSLKVLKLKQIGGKESKIRAVEDKQTDYNPYNNPIFKSKHGIK